MSNRETAVLADLCTQPNFQENTPGTVIEPFFLPKAEVRMMVVKTIWYERLVPD
jgi:hypothetical protein